VGNNEHAADQDEYPDNVSGIMDGPRIISYNLSEDKRPGGIKVRYKIRIVTGPRAKQIDARQAAVIREVLEWSRQHRQHPR
jgi:hypothetical protein